MNKFIKITIASVLAIILFLLFSPASFAQTITEEQTNVLKILEIANGDENGNMNFDANVTRAEFLKMAICASTYKDSALNTQLKISLFPDVKNSHWAAGYINTAINAGLVNGYLDGTFRPSNNVKLEEAVAIVLRLLGYTSPEVTQNYPVSHLQKYRSLELNNNIYAKQGDILKREECMILIYNMLNTKNSQANVYCKTLGYETNSEDVLDFSALLEKELEGPVLIDKTTNLADYLPFKTDSSTVLQLNNANKPDYTPELNDVIYYSKDINIIYAFRKSATGVVESLTNSNLVLSGKTYSIATSKAKSKLSLGGEFSEENAFVTLILGINDTVIDVKSGDITKINQNTNNKTYSEIVSATLKGPYIVNKDGAMDRLEGDMSNAEIFNDNKKITINDIRPYDVYYYSKVLNSVWIYRNTVSGTIEDITPVSSPTSVVISGKTYSITKNSDASYALSSFGSFKVGDKATLLLGQDNEVADVVRTDVVSGILYGVITATGEKTYKDANGDEYKAKYVTVTDTTNTSFTYECDNRYLYAGDVVKVAVSESTVKISKLNTSVARGVAASLSITIKNGNFSENCEIIDVRGSEVIKVYPSRIAGIEIEVDTFIYSDVVLFYEFDENKNLTKLILDDFTGDIDDYGIVISSSKGSISYQIDNIKRSFSTESTGCTIGPAKLRVSGNGYSSANPLLNYVEEISTVTKEAIYDTKNKKYEISDNVKVFIRNADTYNYSSINEIIAGDFNTIKAYYDKTPDLGGRIRVIIAY